MLCFNKLTGENNAYYTLKNSRFVGVYLVSLIMCKKLSKSTRIAK